ncbi:hypothetical protein [Natrinema pallidum]|uniref:Uncharacterized protein n=2 Tax=Natrinema pallidum TaxID=69527 RepID=L9YIY1_9EURY|nr:hypothetical protein [Natrinema pallidum]ELY74100.1 hypothetical protein C487_16824 [Natrinema pallidum DSM 3751]QCW02123.1 hypothetical protein FGF80_02235 [Natrinema pallidum]
MSTESKKEGVRRPTFAARPLLDGRIAIVLGRFAGSSNDGVFERVTGAWARRVGRGEEAYCRQVFPPTQKIYTS